MKYFDSRFIEVHKIHIYFMIHAKRVKFLTISDIIGAVTEASGPRYRSTSLNLKWSCLGLVCVHWNTRHGGLPIWRWRVGILLGSTWVWWIHDKGMCCWKEKGWKRIWESYRDVFVEVWDESAGVIYRSIPSLWK